MAIKPIHEENFQTLARAIRSQDAYLVEFTCNTTGATGAYICAMNVLEDGRIQLVPFAQMLDQALEPMLLPWVVNENQKPWENN